MLSNAPGYSETFFCSKIVGLKNSGFEVTLFVQKNTTDFNLCNLVKAPKVSKRNLMLQFLKVGFVLLVFIIRFPKRLSKFIVLERRVNRSWNQIIKNIYNNSHILKSNLDWLHFGFATMAIQSEHVAKAIGAKMAVSLRGFDIDMYPERHPHCYDILWKQVDKVHAISKYLLSKAYQLGLSRGKMFSIISPAVNLNLFSPQGFSFSKDKIKILTVARLHQIKDLNYVIETMAILKRHGTDFEYEIIGDGLEYANLVKQIHRLNLNNEIKLVGKQKHEIIVEALRQADLYIQYSESEGFCNAVLEAQAVGLLCIVSDGGALPENVLHEQTGWVVPKRNPKLLVRTIQEVINLPESVKQKVSIAAKERVKNEFDLNRQQELFKTFYEN